MSRNPSPRWINFVFSNVQKFVLELVFQRAFKIGERRSPEEELADGCMAATQSVESSEACYKHSAAATCALFGGRWQSISKAQSPATSNTLHPNRSSRHHLHLIRSIGTRCKHATTSLCSNYQVILTAQFSTLLDGHWWIKQFYFIIWQRPWLLEGSILIWLPELSNMKQG